MSLFGAVLVFKRPHLKPIECISLVIHSEKFARKRNGGRVIMRRVGISYLKIYLTKYSHLVCSKVPGKSNKHRTVSHYDGV